MRTEQEGEADWIFDEEEVLGNGIGAKHENNNIDLNVDLAEVSGDILLFSFIYNFLVLLFLSL